ncbi:MAG: type I secretion C-terminal target domain-containing protein [Pseudomonadota bacterium]
MSSTATGFEDQDIPVTINVGHPDNSDGSERIKEVVIENVPTGFTLTTTSTSGTLTSNGGGRYTVTGSNDAAIDDVLTNLSLTIAAAPNARTHLDTDFNLSVTVTSEENNPSETGTGEVARLENTENFTVPVTVHAVADAVTHSGSSTIVEDVARTIGSDIKYAKIDTDGTESVTTVAVAGFPSGASVTYTPVGGGTPITFTDGRTIILTGGTEAEIRAALDSLNVQAPEHSDVDINLTISATTTDNTTSPNTADHTETTTWNHSVVVQAVADAPTVSATSNVTGNEDTNIVLNINANRSADAQVDDSEVLSVRVTLPQDGGTAIGTLVATGTVNNGVTVTALGGGAFLIEGPGTGTAAQEEALIDAFLAGGGLALQPRAQLSGTYTGTDGILVEAISTEQATGVGTQVAPNSFGGADNTSQTETVSTTIDVTINPVVDPIKFANSSTIVQENSNSSNPSDPDLVIPLGTRLGISLDDRDGSQSLSLNLTNIPTSAEVAFGATTLSAGGSTIINGVTVSLNGAGTQISVGGVNADDAIDVLETLTLTFDDDDDTNFTVGINGTTVDTSGGPAAPFSTSHEVTIQAVADTPDVTVDGSTTKPTVQEDSGFITYPVTVDLNDDDGSESYQSVVVSFSTPGSGARPDVQFGTTTGVTLDTSVDGQVTITGGTEAQIEAVLASLQVKPGANNGEDITITVTATAVESNPTETNDNGGGVAGDEISVPTAINQATFVIPVDPVPEVPTINAPTNTSGNEDQRFALSGLSVTKATPDSDGSESSFIEIDTTSFPSGTRFFSGATEHTTVESGFLRIPESDLATLQIQAPSDYSGIFDLSVRAVVVDGSSSNSVTSTSAATTIKVDVNPIADPILTPTRSIGVEDNGPIAFGSDIADASTGLRVQDSVVGGPGAGGDETISQVALTVPADTATQTYAMSGTFVPSSGGTINGSGTAQVQLVTDGSGNQTYTITSTIITGAADLALLTDAQRDTAEADIRATLATFQVEMGPTHSDLEGTIRVTATALDVKDGDTSTRDTTYNHEIRIQAVADTPVISATAPSPSTSEDGSAIALNINPDRSPDSDGSETLSVRITVPTDALGPVGTITGSPPSGITVTHDGNGTYLVETTDASLSAVAAETLLDGFLNSGGLSFDPRQDYAGELNLKIESISTEDAVGDQLADSSFGGVDGTSKTETVETTVSLKVNPVVDDPTVKGNAKGLEDTDISVPLNITLGDTDGSETAKVTIAGVVPAGTRIFVAGGIEITPGDGYELTDADIAALTVRPPSNYSSSHSAPIELNIVTTVTDTADGAVSTDVFNDTITIEVEGVADKPNNPDVTVTADEDQPIALGAGILTAASGDLNNTLVDQDGSEKLTIVLEGVPSAVVPSSAIPGGVQFIGGGMWTVSADALSSLVLPAVTNFSGQDPYSTIVVRSVSQEDNGDESTSDPWPVTINVQPVIDDTTVDGFSSWNAGVTVTEDNAISLANAANHVLRDDDGSEQVVSYTFDLSNLIADAEIATQLASLSGAGTGLDKLVDNYVDGSFTYDSGAGTITVAAADIAGVTLQTGPFLDSNVDFGIPVTALVRDTAVLSTGTVTTDKNESTTFNVNLVGDADTPTAFASNATGLAFENIQLVLGGENTDTDSDLGRAESEDQLYYILELLNTADAPRFDLYDSAGNVTGANLGNGSYLLTPAQINDVFVRTVPGPGGEIRFGLTTHTVENDGDRAQSTTDVELTVTVQPNSGTVPSTPPLPPLITIDPVGSDEDGTVTLSANIVADPADTTNPSITVVIGNLPAGTQVSGNAYFNPSTNEWIASADDVNNGLVQISPPSNYSGDLDFTVRAVATNANLQTAQTSDEPHSVPIDPVADGVNISASPATANEDQAFDLNISLSAVDSNDQSSSPTSDTPEVVDDQVFVRVSSGTLSAGTLLATGPNAGFYQMTQAELANLQVTSASNVHGPITVDVRASSTETDDDADGDHTVTSSHSFTVDVTAVADAPTTVATGPFSGSEDSEISLAGLNANLVDTDGSEVLSIKISGVPDGALFNAGTNNGDGSWTVPKSALDANTLTLTPPTNYSGALSLTIEAFALETSNGNANSTATPFTVTVEPVADEVLMLAKNVAVDTKGRADLDLNVRMTDDNGSRPGENPAEQVVITFSDVPDGISLEAGSGGVVNSLGSNQWQFTGTEAQANELDLRPDAAATGGTYVISVSAVTKDGTDTLATPVTDTFQLRIPDVIAGDANANTLTGSGEREFLFGLEDDDILIGAGRNDYLSGGTGADVLTGGAGADTFSWRAGDNDGSVDQITDFDASEGDVIDISDILIGFDESTSDLSDFVRTSGGTDPVTLEVDVDGAANGENFQEVTTFDIDGQSLDDLRTNGNLIV